LTLYTAAAAALIVEDDTVEHVFVHYSVKSARWPLSNYSRSRL